jgi:hypothetical protein
MPYLEYLFCENCGNHARLDIDPSATLEAYSEEGRKNPAIHQPTFIWDYLIYSCNICQGKFKYTYRDVESRVRSYFSSLSLEYKEYFDNLISTKEEGAASPDTAVDISRSKTADRVRRIYAAKT